MKRAAFKGCVNYVLGKDQAKLLSADGVLLGNANNIIQSFHTQRLIKPNIKHPVGHISLSYSPDDEKRLTDGTMVALAKEYMEKMGIKDTQYILVRHFDNANPHVHLVYNRIDNNGKVISDKNDRYRNEAVCKKLKDKYGLTYGKGKDKVKQEKLRGVDKAKYQVYNAVKDTLPKSSNWNDFEKLLKEKGVALSFKYKGQTDVVQGISFTKGSMTFKGSEIDRGFSYSKLDAKLSENSLKFQQTVNVQLSQQNNSTHSNLGSLFSFTGGGDGDNGNDFEEEQFAKRMQHEQKKINRKNKNREGRSM